MRFGKFIIVRCFVFIFVKFFVVWDGIVICKFYNFGFYILFDIFVFVFMNFVDGVGNVVIFLN